MKKRSRPSGRPLTSYDKLVPELPGYPWGFDYLIGPYHGLGAVLPESGRIQEAEAAYRRAIELEEALLGDHATASRCRLLSWTYRLLDDMLDKDGQVEEARQAQLAIHFTQHNPPASEVSLPPSKSATIFC